MASKRIDNNLKKAPFGPVTKLVPAYNTHKEHSREHFCPAASYITVLSIIPQRNTTT